MNIISFVVSSFQYILCFNVLDGEKIVDAEREETQNSKLKIQPKLCTLIYVIY